MIVGSITKLIVFLQPFVVVMKFSSHAEVGQIVADVIRRRQTFKVMADPDRPPEISLDRLKAGDAVVDSSIRTAAWAPFHYDRAVDGMAEPWRVDVIRRHDCQTIAKELRNWFDDVKPSNKLPAMLSACGSLVLVSWLPQFMGDTAEASEKSKASRIQTDEEHLAATAAYVQNLMLLLTAHGLGTYWSSGGQFRQPLMFEKLGLKHRGRLLAGVFVDYSDPENDTLDRFGGKLRDRRCAEAKWMSVVDLAE